MSNSTATTWALYALTKDKKIQDKLRGELSTVSTDNPTMEELNSLPYLDAVVRETLRVYPPVTATVRTAVEDDVLPLGNPVKDRNGKLHHDIRLVCHPSPSKFPDIMCPIGSTKVKSS